MLTPRRDEVPLSTEPLRMDYLLLRRMEAAPTSATGSTLRGLWPRLSLATIIELKTLGRPYRTGDLDRLWSYLHLFRTDQDSSPPLRGDLRAALVVPARTPALFADVDEMGLRWEDLGRGYWQLHGGLFTLYLVEMDVVSEQEDDDFLRGFTHWPQRTHEGLQFWAELVGSKEVGMSLHEMDGYDEVIRKFLSTLSPEQILEAVPAETIASKMTLEQRLAGVDQEQILLRLPDAALRSLSDEYLATLSEPTREAIRQRVGR